MLARHMKSLIIYAHPATEGHCSAILKEVKSNLEAKKIKYDIIDLYRIKYDPILHESEHYTAGNRNISGQNRKFQRMISNSDLLIFIYPIWWGSMPAILKGFFDRVLTSGFAFRYEKGRPVSMLKGKKAIVFTTSGGPLWAYRLSFNMPKRVMNNFILRFCGINPKYCQIGSCTRFSKEKVPKIKKFVRTRLASI